MMLMMMNYQRVARRQASSCWRGAWADRSSRRTEWWKSAPGRTRSRAAHQQPPSWACRGQGSALWARATCPCRRTSPTSWDSSRRRWPRPSPCRTCTASSRSCTSSRQKATRPTSTAPATTKSPTPTPTVGRWPARRPGRGSWARPACRTTCRCRWPRSDTASAPRTATSSRPPDSRRSCWSRTCALDANATDTVCALVHVVTF